MFELWEQVGDYRTLFRVDRNVRLDIGQIFPCTGVRKDALPLWVRACGLALEPVMPARQVAWIRRADGGWLAAVQVPASSANGRSRLRMNLWVPAGAIDLGVTETEGHQQNRDVAADGRANGL